MVILQIEITTEEELDLFGHFFNSPETMKKVKTNLIHTDVGGVDYLCKTSGWNFIRSKK